MEKKKEIAIDNFLDLDEKDSKKIITSRGELVEKIDRDLVIEDGRQLLREHY